MRACVDDGGQKRLDLRDFAKFLVDRRLIGLHIQAEPFGGW